MLTVLVIKIEFDKRQEEEEKHIINHTEAQHDMCGLHACTKKAHRVSTKLKDFRFLADYMIARWDIDATQ